FIIIIVTIFPPADGVNLSFGEYQQLKNYNFLAQLVSAITVEDFNLMLSKNAMLPLIIFSIVLGYCIRMVIKDSDNNGTQHPVVIFLDTMSNAFMKMINLIMLY